VTLLSILTMFRSSSKISSHQPQPLDLSRVLPPGVKILAELVNIPNQLKHLSLSKRMSLLLPVVAVNLDKLLKFLPKDNLLSSPSNLQFHLLLVSSSSGRKLLVLQLLSSHPLFQLDPSLVLVVPTLGLLLSLKRMFLVLMIE
jgi:hypothetical protein